ncbi:hypothetical protein GF373_14720, partial [bacterium]|nr:hypothetical protein [bacterium]
MKKRYPLLLCAILFSTMHISLADTPYAQWENGPPAEESFFPIGVWLQHPNNAPKYKNMGINLYIGLWQGPTPQQLATLKQHAMPVICHQSPTGLTHKDNDIIIGWLQQDEPDNAQPVTDPDTGEKTYGPPVPPKKIVAKYEGIKQNDPTRPVLLNLGQGVANDQWHGRGPGADRSDYLTYVKGGDIVSFDYYPIAGSQTPKDPDHLPLIAKGINRLQKWTEN